MYGALCARIAEARIGDDDELSHDGGDGDDRFRPARDEATGYLGQWAAPVARHQGGAAHTTAGAKPDHETADPPAL